MFRNYLLSTLRSLAREKLYTFINAVGLSIGLATCFLIYSWVQFEESYDNYPSNSDRVYRVTTKWDESSELGRATTYPMVRTRVLSQFPEVEISARVFDRGFLGSKTRISYRGNVFTDSKFFFADPTFFKIFPFPFIKGDAHSALTKPNAVVITQHTAEKYFGKEDPLGKILSVGDKQEFEVTGVIEDIPSNTHFHFDLIASMQSHPWIKMAEDNVWSGIVFHTYVQLKEQASSAELEKKITDLLDHFPNDPKGYGKGLDLQLQPIRDIHLKSALGFEFEANGNLVYVRLFISIAILVLVMAIINYANLASAQHTKRLKEVGVRKVMGASRGTLIVQFVTESLVITLFAFGLALIWIKLSMPWLPVLSGQEYLSSRLSQPQILGVCIFITALIGFLTGIFPALALSSFKPARLFAANISASGGGITLRKLLMISQFTISIALTICTAIIYQQVKFLREEKLGYNLDHTLVLNIGYKEIHGKYNVFKSQLMQNPAILGATATSQLPTDIQTEENIDISSSQSLGVRYISVDPDFFSVMGVQLRQGGKLISSISISDSVNQFVLNKNTINAIGWTEEEALKKRISIRHGNQRPGEVLGVASDFHFQSLHHTIEPLVLEFNPGSFQYLLVKVKPENLPATISFVSKTWGQLAEGVPFEYMFLDQEYNRLYKSEIQTGSLFNVFSAMAILISLLGLFGLSSFSVERRTKEIGLRKILGANNRVILALVSRNFMWLLTISFVLAIPVGYYFMNVWMSSFAFRANISPWLFLLAGVGNIALGFITLLYHSLRIAETNPVDTLRYE